VKDELLLRLQDEEDNFTERKPESAGKSDWKRTLVSFANSVPENRTAVLFIGVADNGMIQGVDNSDSLQKKIRKICKQECYPPITFQTEVVTVEGKTVVAVVVTESFSRPHFAGPAYVREGSESVRASDELFEDLITSRTDPGRAILMHKGEAITVIVHRKLLGSTEYLGDGRYLARHECRVESCNPHYVTLYDYANKQMVTEPLKNVTVSFDHKCSRFQLDIEPN
jgi:hypothetical protein